MGNKFPLYFQKLCEEENIAAIATGGVPINDCKLLPNTQKGKAKCRTDYVMLKIS